MKDILARVPLEHLEEFKKYISGQKVSNEFLNLVDNDPLLDSLSDEALVLWINALEEKGKL